MNEIEYSVLDFYIEVKERFHFDVKQKENLIVEMIEKNIKKCKDSFDDFYTWEQYKAKFLNDARGMVVSFLFQHPFFLLSGDFQTKKFKEQRRIVNDIYEKWDIQYFVKKFDNDIIQAFKSI